MSLKIKIPFHATSVKAIQNIHMGRDVRSDIPEEEADAIMSLKTNYAVIYEYTLNKFPDKYKDGDEIIFYEEITRGKRKEEKEITRISKKTTNYLGERARVQSDLPKTESAEPPKEPPKAEAVEPPKEVASETGAVETRAEPEKPPPNPTVPLPVKSDTGAVAPAIELVEPTRKEGETNKEYIDRWTAYLYQMYKKTQMEINEWIPSIYYESSRYFDTKEQKEKRLKEVKEEIIDKYLANSKYGFNFTTDQPEPLSKLMKPFVGISGLAIKAILHEKYPAVMSSSSDSPDEYLKKVDMLWQKEANSLMEKQRGYFSYNAKLFLNEAGGLGAIQQFMKIKTPYVNAFIQFILEFKGIYKREALEKVNKTYSESHLNALYVRLLNEA